MGAQVRIDDGGVVVELTGFDRLFNLRRSVAFTTDQISDASVNGRSELERLIDHRGLGRGTHNGARRPDRARIGTMYGRTIAGKQFWAVPATEPTTQLLVLDLNAHHFARAVLDVGDAADIAAELRK